MGFEPTNSWLWVGAQLSNSWRSNFHQLKLNQTKANPASCANAATTKLVSPQTAQLDIHVSKEKDLIFTDCAEISFHLQNNVRAMTRVQKIETWPEKNSNNWESVWNEIVFTLFLSLGWFFFRYVHLDWKFLEAKLWGHGDVTRFMHPLLLVPSERERERQRDRQRERERIENGGEPFSQIKEPGHS